MGRKRCTHATPVPYGSAARGLAPRTATASLLLEGGPTPETSELNSMPIDDSPATRPRWLPLTRRLAAGAAIMVYHGLAPTEIDERFGTMHVWRDRLEATIRALKRVANLVSVREVLERHRTGRSTKGLVAFSFDDAYASVRSEGLAFLLAEAVPVTLFVVVDRARAGKPFWWDRVDHLFPLTPPDRWRALEDACGLPQAFRAGQPRDMGPLRPLRQWILSEFRGRWPERLEPLLERLETEIGQSTPQRPLTFPELDGVMVNPLVEVGGHTMTHPVLPLLPDDELRSEVRGSFEVLRARYPGALPVLAPPFGLYDARTIRIAQEEGLTACLTLSGTQVDDRSPTNLIPRFGLTARHQPWKAVLYALGCWHRVRPRPQANTDYPDLPSAVS